MARAIDAAGGDRLTETGLTLGTPAYMSPEQVGCVLYEMLGGEPPFTGPTAASVTQQQLLAEPRPVTQLRPTVPAGCTRGGHLVGTEPSSGG